MDETRRKDAAEFDQRDFRNALGRFATGVTVITTMGPGGKPEGLTVNSFSAVSLDEPLILWCMAKSSPSLPIFMETGHFAVNVLTSSQQNLSNTFSASAKDKFSGVEWRQGLGGAPVLNGCLASFECRNSAQHEGGDHLILIGAVEKYDYHEGQPLLFLSGNYTVPA
ncbi:MAG: flavin reductase family protein [Rhodospirillales bacterium]|nr:flavin reductase family protein [Rhodospirillales bacterium]